MPLLLILALFLVLPTHAQFTDFSTPSPKTYCCLWGPNKEKGDNHGKDCDDACKDYQKTYPGAKCIKGQLMSGKELKEDMYQWEDWFNNKERKNSCTHWAYIGHSADIPFGLEASKQALMCIQQKNCEGFTAKSCFGVTSVNSYENEIKSVLSKWEEETNGKCKKVIALEQSFTSGSLDGSFTNTVTFTIEPCARTCKLKYRKCSALRKETCYSNYSNVKCEEDTGEISQLICCDDLKQLKWNECKNGVCECALHPCKEVVGKSCSGYAGYEDRRPIFTPMCKDSLLSPPKFLCCHNKKGMKDKDGKLLDPAKECPYIADEKNCEWGDLENDCPIGKSAIVPNDGIPHAMPSNTIGH